MLSVNNLTPDILKKLIEEAEQSYYKLLLLISPYNSNLTSGFLADFSHIENYPYINLNLYLSQRLLHIPNQERCFQSSTILDKMVDEITDKVIILDNIEILFEPSLKMDPLGTLQRMARSRIIAASWHGSYHNGILTYAAQGHPEFHSYSQVEALVMAK